MQPPAESLRRLLNTVPSELAGLSDATAALKPAPEKWSPKEELGHLLDSAANNHQRIVRMLIEDQPAMPGYEQQRWVQVHRYQQRDWRELIDQWAALNRQLLIAVPAMTDSAWNRTCTIAGSEPVTLRFVLEDYLAHMSHHLAHIKSASHTARGEKPSTTD
ncbi:MAG TPA: DinB family protein [Candidatus Acidoferrales bacterium]|nr:DinB family protein [Candidatus Acidoferrales bacterium]